MSTTNALVPTTAGPPVPSGLLIAGHWVDSRSGRTFEVENPTSGAILATIADGNAEDAEAALAAAVEAQASWGRTPPRVRSEILRRGYDLVMERSDWFAEIMTSEMGKPLSEAKGEVAYAAEFLRWFSEEAVRISGDHGTTGDGANRIIVTREPVGPCVLITPWNFPLAMGTRKVAPAVAAGCTMVLKPAAQTPLTSLALAATMEEAGLPAGVLNVVNTTTSDKVVERWMSDGRARKLSFTGSTQVGRLLLRRAADTVMRTSMELGGNAPFIVCADADLDIAIQGALAAKMRNMGEACTAANRIYVHRSIAEAFSERLAEAMSQLQVGNGLDDGVAVGPLIDSAGRDKVQRLVNDAVERGARVLTGGGVPEGRGYFYPPTVLTDVATESALMSEEIFGPVAPVVPFDNEDEIIRIANDTEWGLVGFVFTTNIDRAFDLSERLEVGMVGVNTGIVSNPSAPFGGVKQSGIGREGGRVGIDEFLEYKYLAVPRRPGPVPQ